MNHLRLSFLILEAIQESHIPQPHQQIRDYISTNIGREHCCNYIIKHGQIKYEKKLMMTMITFFAIIIIEIKLPTIVDVTTTFPFHPSYIKVCG